MPRRSSPESTVVLHGMAQTPETSPEVAALRQAGVDVIAPELAISHASGVVEISLQEKQARIEEALARDVSDFVVVSHAHYPFQRVVEESPELVSYARRVTLVTPPIRYPVSTYETMHRTPSDALRELGAVSMVLVGQGDEKMEIGFTDDYLTDAREIEKDALDRIVRLSQELAKRGIPQTVIIPERRDPVGFSYKDRAQIPRLAGKALLGADWFMAPKKSHGLGKEYGRDIADLLIHGVLYPTRLQPFDPRQNESTDQ